MPRKILREAVICLPGGIALLGRTFEILTSRCLTCTIEAAVLVLIAAVATASALFLRGWPELRRVTGLRQLWEQGLKQFAGQLWLPLAYTLYLTIFTGFPGNVSLENVPLKAAFLTFLVLTGLSLLLIEHKPSRVNLGAWGMMIAIALPIIILSLAFEQPDNLFQRGTAKCIATITSWFIAVPFIRILGFVANRIVTRLFRRKPQAT